MRTFFYVTGIAAVTLFAILALCMGLSIYSSIQVKKEGDAFANAAVVAITSKWDAEALLNRASPELTKVSSPAQVRSLFDRIDVLGALVAQVQECQNTKINVFSATNQKTIVTSFYNCAAVYKNNSATINLILVERDGTWKIRGFHVNSPIFAAPTVRKA